MAPQICGRSAAETLAKIIPKVSATEAELKANSTKAGGCSSRSVDPFGPGLRGGFLTIFNVPSFFGVQKLRCGFGCVCMFLLCSPSCSSVAAPSSSNRVVERHRSHRRSCFEKLPMEKPLAARCGKDSKGLHEKPPLQTHPPSEQGSRNTVANGLQDRSTDLQSLDPNV